MSISSITSTADDFDETREIKCPIHGYIPVSKFITTIIDTPQFQRLRYLKQLGTSYYVWPGASHNRFEHALGVYHLASLMVRRLERSQPDLNITERDVRCVEVAGLCHDLGHGPFSHVWDNTFIPKAIPNCSWKHEDASEMMLDYLVRDNNIDLKSDEVRFIKDLIQGEKRHTADHDPPEKDFLFEIIANKKNGIDVDKFDYIGRDIRAVGDGTSMDLRRLVNTARVIDGQICYSEKNAMTVYSLFQERFNLHKMIYNHKTAKSIEYMIVDTLLGADPVMKISNRIYDPKTFMHLTDDILLEVERSESPDLEESRRLIRRIRNRDLYRMVDKMNVPWESRKVCAEHFTPKKILEAARALPIDLGDQSPEKKREIQNLIRNLKEEHIIVDFATLHHGMGEKFPLDNCKFYGKYEINKAYPPRRADISHLLPSSFGELLIRVFTRDSSYYGAIQHAVRHLISCLSPASPTDTNATDTQRERSVTPEIPRTPPSALTSQLSNASIISLPGDGMDDNAIPSTPQFSKTGPLVSVFPSATPLPNKFMTVPINFTPKTPKSCARPRHNREDSEINISGFGDVTPKPESSAGLNVKKRGISQLEEAAEVVEVDENDMDISTDIEENKRDKTILLTGNKKKKTKA